MCFSSTDQFLAAAAAASTSEKLGEENKGHMLLKKMGEFTGVNAFVVRFFVGLDSTDLGINKYFPVNL